MFLGGYWKRPAVWDELKPLISIFSHVAELMGPEN